MDMIVPILFWLSITLSLGFSVVGILKEKYWFLLIGAMFFIPIAYYFNGSPSFYGVGLFLPVFQVVSAAAVMMGRRLWAWLFLIPAFLVVIWFIFIIFYQFSQGR
jgi:hypothetical protein